LNVRYIFIPGAWMIFMSERIGEEMGVSPGDTISVNYIGRLDDGTVFDTSYEDIAKKEGIYTPQRIYEPLIFEVGAGQVIKGFDEAVIGMKVNETKEIVIPPGEAYGEWDPNMVTVVPRETEIPLEERFDRSFRIPLQEFYMGFGEGHEVGDRLLAPGSEIHLIVDEISPDGVLLSYDLKEGDRFTLRDLWNETVVAVDDDQITVRHELNVGDRVTLPQQPWSSLVVAVSEDNATLLAEEMEYPEIQTPYGLATVSMNEKEITIDFNHRLAGKTLTFEVTVVSINR